MNATKCVGNPFAAYRKSCHNAAHPPKFWAAKREARTPPLPAPMVKRSKSYCWAPLLPPAAAPLLPELAQTCTCTGQAVLTASEEYAAALERDACCAPAGARDSNISTGGAHPCTPACSQHWQQQPSSIGSHAPAQLAVHLLCGYADCIQGQQVSHRHTALPCSTSCCGPSDRLTHVKWF